MQLNLFNMPRMKDPVVPQVPKVRVPACGDKVTLPNINDGIEAVVVGVYPDQLMNSDAYPFRCWIPKLGIHVRQRREQVVANV